LIVGIGDPQGTLPRRHLAIDLHPFVNEAALEQPVSHLVVFDPGTWERLRRARHLSDVSSTPHRIVELPFATTIEAVLDRRELLSQRAN
jgi:hypothetical protein